MDYILYGYQIVPGSDEIISFHSMQAEAESEALAQRAVMRKTDPDDEIMGMAIYRYVIRSLNTVELVRVMNGEASVTDIGVIDRRLVALVAD